MNRFFTENVVPGRAEITGEDVRHIRQVLRLEIGDGIIVCDGAGTEYRAEITGVEKDRVICALGGPEPCATEPGRQIVLFQGIPKSGKLETVIQKSVELGAFAVVPVMMERCMSGSDREFDKKLVRLNRVAEEAAKQCGRGIIPRVLPMTRLKNLRPEEYDLILTAYEGERETGLKQVLTSHDGARRIAVVIGPEGGITEEEIALLRGKGAETVSLGPRILRTETAGPAMIAQMLYEWEG